VRAQRREEATPVIRQAAAVCLGYPDRDVIATSGLVRAALAENAPRQGEGFEPLFVYWESSDLAAIQTHYVDVFDLSRKHSLYLSYWIERGTPYAGVLTAVCSTLPGVSPADRKAVMAMAAAGPPTESVGLEPTTPQFLPLGGSR
jgi:hypothetical protein